jgi:hypothetical protein
MELDRSPVEQREASVAIRAWTLWKGEGGGGGFIDTVPPRDSFLTSASTTVPFGRPSAHLATIVIYRFLMKRGKSGRRATMDLRIDSRGVNALYYYKVSVVREGGEKESKR